MAMNSGRTRLSAIELGLLAVLAFLLALLAHHALQPGPRSSVLTELLRTPAAPRSAAP